MGSVSYCSAHFCTPVVAPSSKIGDPLVSTLGKAADGAPPTKTLLAGETVLLLKSTALASTVAVTDLLGSANFVRAQTLITYEPLITVALVYMVLAWIIEKLFSMLEKKVPNRTQASMS